MTNLPRDYDAWRLSGPEEREACPLCANTGEQECQDCEGTGCDECDDTGNVPCEHQAPDDDFADWLRDQKQDREMDDE